MSEHTKEPWAFNGARIESRDEHGWANDGWIAALCEGPEAIANARRIVACVNACAGMDSLLLENIAMTGGMVERFSLLNQTEKQRDKLLQAAKNLRDVKGRHHSEQAYARLMEVLAEVEVSQ